MMNHDARLDQVFHALADPNRRVLIDRLASGPATVSDLAKPMAISLPAVLQHLAVLEGCGIVVSQKSGRVRTCTLDPAALSQAEVWINDRSRMWTQRLDALAHHLSQPEDKTP